jgi:hypothetical protein
MAVGEKKFSTKGRDAKRFSSEPFAAGDYEMKVLGDTAEVRKKQQEGDVPTFSYVTCAFEALGTGQDGGRNRRIYHNFFLRLNPGKDGSVITDRADQLVGFARALGEDADVGVVRQNGEDVISAQSLVKWLKANDGAVLNAHIKVARGRKDKTSGQMYSDRNELDYFIESEGGGTGPDSEEEEEEETEEAEESDEEVEEDEDEGEDEEVEDEEPAPKKRTVAKAAPVKKKVRR